MKILMNNEADIQGLAHGLSNWYWASGRKRQGSYELPASGWLSQLYSLVKNSGAVIEALEQQRPAMAIWGPSQTGKSTLISAYIDGHAQLPVDESTAGIGTGLQWPGGKGFYFMAPLVKEVENLPWYLPRKVLNPYNKGMDGSSCLSRFIPGSIDGTPGTVKVVYPQYPSEMKMVTPRDLWHALARGYSSECYGPNQGATTVWDLDKFKAKIKTFVRLHPAQKGSIDRDAYEAMHDFCEVLTDLAESDDPMFRGLGMDSGELASTLRSLLEEPSLLQSRDLALEFASNIFWDGFEQLGALYRTMADSWRTCYGPGGIWEGKKVYCSLEATALFLNMGACNISYAPMPDNPKAPEAILKSLIGKLGWKEQDGNIIIACEDGLPNRMADTPEQFCIYQGLVWELVIPINLSNLEDHPFPDAPQRPNALKEYLQDADILDFPGVGNETKSMERRIILDAALVSQVKAKAAAPGASGQDKERANRCFTPQLFFKEILKRGKTASIVSTYAKRLNIDAFSIFQGIRGYACPNADQLVNGIKAWWKYATPEYFRNARGPSPLPLNLTLTWWATQLNKAVNPNDSNIYGVIEEIVSNLGQIRDPGTCTTFAIHNHKSPDRDFAEIKQDFNPGTIRYQNLMKETAFARQFGNPISRKSFDEMIKDKDTGGAEYFFEEVHRQLLSVRQNDKTNRIIRLKARLHEMQTELETLFKQYEIFPNPKPKDTRREKLESFLVTLDALVKNAGPGSMAKINLALRHLINMDYEVLSAVPDAKSRITSDYIASQYQQWITHQCSLCAENGAGAHAFDPDWRIIGIDGPEKIRDILTSLVKSVAPDTNDAVVWLARLVEFSNSSGKDVPDLRRPLAIKLINIICYGKGGARTSVNPDDDTGTEEIAPEKAAYIYFVEPTIKRIRELASRQIIPIKRPDQDGDDALVELCRKYGVNPLLSKTLQA
jgi:hypothetical protein